MGLRMRSFEVPFLAVLCLQLCGCGGAGGNKGEIHGKATFNGAPIPVGRIDLLPEGGQGGSPGYAIIANGEFDTRSDGRGVDAGKINLRVSGFDGKSQPDQELLHGKPLFTPYTKSIDVTAGTQQIDVDVPKAR